MTSNGYAGPMAVTADQLEAAGALTESVFGFAGRPGRMIDMFPMLYNEDHFDSLRVFMHEGRPVSILGLMVCDVMALGCTTRIGCIGSVCTDESCRGHGLAGRLVDDAKARAAGQGVSVILISGDLDLYMRRGAARVGLFHHYTFAADGLGDGDPEVAADELAEGEARGALEMYASEPVRFVNSEKDYLAMIASGQSASRPGKTYLVRRRGEPVAVVSVDFSYPHRGERVASVRETAGCRKAMLAALPKIIAKAALDVRKVQIETYAADERMRIACAAMGVAPEEKEHSGVVLLVDPRRLVRDFTPLLAQRIGPGAATLSVRPHADEMKINALTFSMGKDELTIEGTETFMAVLFGRPGDDPLGQLTGPLAETLRRAFPLPLPLYGLRYV